MVNSVDDFEGHLLHFYNQRLLFPTANLASGSAVAENEEVEIFPAAFMKLGQVKMPILKHVDMKIVFEHHTLPPKINDDGYYNCYAYLYNADEDDIDDSNLIGVAVLTIADHNSGVTWSISNTNLPLQKSFGKDGILLRPKITIRHAVGNTSGIQIALDSFRLELVMDIDWVDVSEKEFQDYLQELWFAQEFD